MQVYPEKYDKLDLSTSERSFIRTMDRTFHGDQLAYFVLQINPRKKDVGQGKAELFNMLLIPEGIFLFRFFDSDVPMTVSMTIKALGNPIVYSIMETDIRGKLEESNFLVRDSGNLRFALNICFVFPNISGSQVESDLSGMEKQFCHEHALFKEDLQTLRKEGKDVLLKRIEPADEIEENTINYVFQRLCPEITIPRKFILDSHATISIKEFALTQMDRAVQSYRLDNWQIDIVKQAVISFIDSVINKLVNKEGVTPEKIVVLSNLRLDQSVLNGVKYVGGCPLTTMIQEEEGAVTFATVGDFKGLESDIIIFINHTYRGEVKTETVRAIEYTALTRARFYLYVIDYERSL